MDETSKEMAQQSEAVVLVHGTFAARDSDSGDSWWQRESEAWNGLKERLPEHARLSEKGRLFHWSGENSERGRIKAARELLSKLLKFESNGEKYHLVGHSHGGSVIWHTLRLAALQKNSLSGLKSWSTVGTPFLHHQTSSPWHILNILKVILAIALIGPAFRTIRKLFQLIGSALFGMEHGVTLPTDGGVGWISPNRVGVRIIELLGVPVREVPEGFRVGTFDPSQQSVVEYVFTTPEGWLVLFIGCLLAYVYLNVAVFLVSPILESLRIRKEKRFEQRVMETFQSRWLGIWSPDDEAINGLRATLELSISFVSRMAPREKVLLSDKLSLISKPHQCILTPIYNSVIRPFLDKLVLSQVIKTAQGNNRPAAEVVAVSTAPVSREGAEDLPCLPTWLNEVIRNDADLHAGNITPTLRMLMAEPSFVSGIERFGKTLSGREMVHTSYFDHSVILDLLAMHIRWSNDKSHPHLTDHQQAQVYEWMLEFKSHLCEVDRNFKPTQNVPRRRTRAA